MPSREQRQALREEERSRPKAIAHPIVAPIGGLNARDSLAEMPETDAIILDNWFCQPTWLEFRKGRTTLATPTGNAETVMGYRGVQSVGNFLFAGVNNGGVYGIYRVDNAGGGSPGAAVVGGAGNTIQALHATVFDYNQFGSGSGEFLWALNASGQDLPLLFDGNAWNAVSISGGTYQLTGGPSGGSAAGLKTLSQVAVYKQRLWFLQQGTFQVWYLPQLQAAGALTNLNIGADFKEGGYLVAMITISIDNASGLQDFMAFASSEGEVVVYQGYDPAAVATWSIAAHFKMGRLMAPGRKGWCKIGSDALMLTVDGAVLLSQALLTDRSQTRQAVTDKIRTGLNSEILIYPNAPGWQVQLYPMGNKLLINNPTSSAFATSFQWVQNTLTGAWSTFGLLASSWNAFCFENWGDNLYMGQANLVSQADNTLQDAGMGFTTLVKPAFSQFGEEGKLKRWALAQPIFQVTGAMSVGVRFNVDFDVSLPTGSVPVSSGSGAPWNSSPWNTSYWGDATLIAKPWLGLIGEGYYGTLTMQIAPNNIAAKWITTNFLYEPGGLLYGFG